MDIDDFDIDRSTRQAWDAFGGRLSEVLSMMDSGAELRLGMLAPDDDEGLPENAGPSGQSSGTRPCCTVTERPCTRRAAWSTALTAASIASR